MNRMGQIAFVSMCLAAVAAPIAAFAAGTLPSGYTEVEYIQPDGNDNDRIITDYVPTPNDDKIEAVVEFPTLDTTQRAIWCARASFNSRTWTLFVNAAKKFRYDYGNTISQVADVVLATDQRYTVTAASNQFSFVSAAQSGGYTHAKVPDFTAGGPVVLFSAYYDGTANHVSDWGRHRLYSFKVWRSGTLIHYFVPCKDSGGAATMVDICDNPATLTREGTFTAGAEGHFYDHFLFPTDGLLNITGSPANFGTPSPAYGLLSNLAAGETRVASCGAPMVTNAAEDIEYACTGWKLYDEDGVVVSNGTATSFTYTHPSPAAYRQLEWQWMPSSVKGTVAAGAGGSVSPSGTAWYATDSPVAVTATPDAGKTFVKWTGELPAGVSATAASVTFTPTAPFEMTALFGASFYVAMTGSDGDDGSEAHPFATISNAIEKADAAIADGAQYGIIHVADGSYPENGLVVTNAIVISGNASDRTAVKVGTSGARVFRIAHADAVLRNLTVQNGTVTTKNEADAGGNVRLENGTVANCVLSGGGKASLTDYKGGNLYISAGSAVDCLLTSPLAGPGMYGANAYIAGGVVSRCILENAPKTSSWTALGSGAYLTGGVIENCLLRGNYAGHGTLHLKNSAKAINCTIVNNLPEIYQNGGVAGVMIPGNNASAINCVIFGNGGTATAEWANQSGARFFNCVSTVDNGNGANWIKLPFTNKSSYFEDDESWTPLLGSPMVDGGDDSLYPSTSSQTDLAGNARLSGRHIDIGCRELDQSRFNVAAAVTSHPSVLKGATVDFVCCAAGATGAVTYELDFGDGSAHLVTSNPQVSRRFDVVGFFTVRVRGRDGSGEYGDWVVVSVPVCVAETDIYVSPEGNDANAGTAAAPFRTVAHALATLTNLNSSCATDVDGVTVHVADGTYEENGLPAIGSRVTVEGNASDRTAVKVGKSGARIFCLADEDAVLRNLTVTNGTVLTKNEADAGGNVRLENGTVTNCVLTGGGNSSLTDDKGANLYVGGGMAVDCLLTSPRTGSGSYGLGAYITGGVVSRCIIENAPQKPNSYTPLGAGAYLKGGVIENCLVRDNKAGRGAIYLNAASARAVNCTIVGNTPVSGSGAGVGGVYVNNASALVVNCVIYGNGGTALAEWANKNAATFYNCAFSADAAFTGANSTVKDLTDADFKSAANGNYRPKSGSALFDAGDNERYSANATSATDLDGAKRIQGKGIDIGCWEYQLRGTTIIVR